MSPTLIYPVPNETPEVWNIFRPYVSRFASTLRSFDPGAPYVLRPIHTGDWTDELTQLFAGIEPLRPIRYLEAGCDIGAAQFAAKFARPEEFLIPMTSRTYWHRPGWLPKLLTARDLYGPGLYGCSASNQNRPHVCVRQYGIDAADFQEYPILINSRPLGQVFECGYDYQNAIGGMKGISIFEFMQLSGRPIKIVRFDGIFERDNSIWMPEGFRNGGQSEMLAWDKHTDIFANSNAREKRELQLLTHGGR